MTRIIRSNLVTTADSDHAIDDGDQPVFVNANVVVGAEGVAASAVYAATGGLYLITAGHLFSNSRTVRSEGIGTNYVQVQTGGSISSTSSSTGAISTNSRLELINAGTISARLYAVEAYSAGIGHLILNSGTITSSYVGIYYEYAANLASVITNSGTILADEYAIYDGGTSADVLTNSGLIVGDIYMGSGADSIDTRSGMVIGQIEAGSGDDVIYGSLTHANDLNGGSGDDLLVGGGAADRIEGGPGADEIDGGGGIDTAAYQYAASAVTVDLRDNGANTGLAAGDMLISIENILGSDFSDRLYGDGGANQVQGGAGSDILDGREGNDKLYGGSGADRMSGGAGNDVFWVDDIGDVVIELANQGTDEVRSSVTFSLAGQQVEKLTLVGSAAANATGNALDNSLTGNDAINILTGGLGKDMLTGKGGADQFLMFGALGASNVDTITDFVVNSDKIVLDRTFFPAVNAPGPLDATTFDNDGLPDANDRILYNAATGAIAYDLDGSGAGAAVLFAYVMPGLALTANDFLIIA